MTVEHRDNPATAVESAERLIGAVLAFYGPDAYREAEGAAMLAAGAADQYRAPAGRPTSALAIAARVAIERWLEERAKAGEVSDG